MNAFTKMVLISEDEYKNKCQLLDTSIMKKIMSMNMDNATKVKIANNALLKHILKSQKEPNNTLINEKPNIPLEKERSTSNWSEISDDQKFESILNDSFEPETQTLTNKPSHSDNFSSTPIPSIKNPSSTVSASESTQKSRAYDLEKALREIPSLVTIDGKVLKADGSAYHNSNIKRIVNFLCLFKTTQAKKMATPIGTERVIQEIEKLPYLFDQVNNSPALRRFGDKGKSYETWKKLSEMNTSLSKDWEL